MEESVQTSTPLLKRLDKFVFNQIDKFKSSPGFNSIQDFYNNLEEEQQKILKGGIILFIFFLPLLFLGIIFWQNSKLKEDLEMRVALISKANEIIGQRQSLQNIGGQILSPNPIDGQDMMSSRASSVLTQAGVELSKIKIENYQGNPISDSIMSSEADFKYSNISTDELMNVLIQLIQVEKFRIQDITITRNPENNLLQGQFRVLHLGNSSNRGEN